MVRLRKCVLTLGPSGPVNPGNPDGPSLPGGPLKTEIIFFYINVISFSNVALLSTKSISKGDIFSTILPANLEILQFQVLPTEIKKINRKKIIR